MEWWWEQHKDSLPEATIEDRNEIEDLTGCVPLLLGDLSHQDYKGRIYIEVKEQILGSKALENVEEWTAEFVKTAKLKWTSGEFTE
jgi:hypothetical protein